MNPFDDDDNKVYISMTYTAYGKTHSVWIDEYVPENKTVEAPSAPLPTPDLPF